jgi:hypothetical protein
VSHVIQGARLRQRSRMYPLTVLILPTNTCIAALSQEMNFTFSNILGSPYRGGSLLLHGDTLICPAGNRIREVSLREATSLTYPIQAPHQIQSIALSPDGTLLLAVDTAARALLIVRHTRVLLHRWTLKNTCRCARFSPDGLYIALAAGKLLQECCVSEALNCFDLVAYLNTYLP